MIDLYNCATMLKVVTDVTPSALLLVDAAGKIIDAYLYRHSKRQEQRFANQDLRRILRRILARQAADQIWTSFKQCSVWQHPVSLNGLVHVSRNGLSEYFALNFSYITENKFVVIYVRNITESVLLEEEFCTITKRHETMHQELCTAMTELDLQLMDSAQTKKKLSALYRITSIVQRTVNEQEVLNEILDGLTTEPDFVNAAIMLLDEASQELVISAHRGYYSDIPRVPVGKGITGCAAQRRELIYVPDISRDERYIPGTRYGVSEVAVPLIVDERLIGVLDVETPQGKVLQDYDLDLLRSLASQIAMSIAHANHVAKIQMQAITDGLTGLFNHRYFVTLLEQEIKRAKRYQRHLALLMLDIDDFKHYNDIFGHRMGDHILNIVASLINSSCRDVDYVCRYGGEEFAVLLPETKIEEATVIADRIRTAIEAYPFPFGPGKHQQISAVTVSIGVASYPDNASSEIELVDHADAALYTAKRLNKNCIYAYNDACRKIAGGL